MGRERQLHPGRPGKREALALNRVWGYDGIEGDQWEDSPLYLQSIGSNDSIMLSSYLLFDQRQIHCPLLVDSGCSAVGFLDDDFASYHQIQRFQLPRPRPLHLADGVFSSYITHLANVQLRLGHHYESVNLYITRLSTRNPIILGLPWLKEHNPTIDWETSTLCFGAKCAGRCFPTDLPQALRLAPKLAAPRPTGGGAELRQAGCVTPPRPRRPYQASVEDVPDEGEPTSSTRSALTPERRRKRAEYQRGRRQHQRLLTRLNGAPPTLTNSPPGQQGRMISWRPPVLPPPARRVGNARHSLPRHSTPAAPRATARNTDPMNENDIRLLDILPFTFAAKQEGVDVSVVTMAELTRACEIKEPIVLPEVPEEVYEEILLGRGDAEVYKKLFPEDTHEFLDQCYVAAQLRRVSEEDAKIFLDKSDKGPLPLEEIKRRVPAKYHDLIAAFLPQDAEKLAPHRRYDHKIELVPGSVVPYARSRPLSPLELKVLKRWLDDNLAKGWIRPSQSSAASPILIARKPGGGVRICVDYRGVNNISLKNRYPLPLIRETLDAVCKAKIFTKLDVIAAFNRVRIAEGYEWLTAFITRFGLYETLVTPFGLCGAPSTFQHYINDTLYDALDQYATAYLDDIIIYSDNPDQHTQHVREVLRRMISAGLQIDVAKCEFDTTRTKYLGIIVTPGGIEMDKTKVEAVVTWQEPATKKQLQAFLGFANFYRRFIKNFSGITRPLHDLTKKTAEWDWTAARQEAFERLKRAFTEAPTLRVFDWDKPAVVEVDASNWASGGVLSQRDDNGELRPVAFFSSKHSAQEVNYDIYDKELLAVIRALEEWRPELEGSQEPFEIVTDHKNLQYFATTKELTQRHMRWSEFLSRFNFRITYKPGATNVRPDALSRKPEHRPQNDEDDRLINRRRPVIPRDRFDAGFFGYPEVEHSNDCLRVVLRATETPKPEEFIPLYALDASRPVDELIDESYAASPFLQEILAWLTNGQQHRGWPPSLAKALKIPIAETTAVRGRIYYRGRLVVDPADTELQANLIYRAHDTIGAGHPGRTKTLDLMGRTYWWRGMAQTVRSYVAGCLICAKTKKSRSAAVGFLKPLPVPLSPWRDISVDYITPLPDCSRGPGPATYNHVLVVVDRLTKMRHYIPMESMTADEMARAFISRVYCLHGLPDTIISDRGSQFVSVFWKALSDALGVALKPSSGHHPETNGQTERINAELKQFLRLYINWSQDDWVDWLPLAEFAGNNAVSETTGVSPFYANYGFNPRMGIETGISACPPDYSNEQKREFFKAQELATRFKAVWDQVISLSKQAQERYEEQANRNRVDAPIFKPGDLVLLDMSNLKTGRPHEGLAPKYEGPFEVIQSASHNVKLRLPDNIKVNNVFHVSKVKLYVPPVLPQQRGQAQEVRANEGREITRTDEVDDRPQALWEVEALLDYGKAPNGRYNYLVKWKGPHAPSWQPASDLDLPQVHDLVRDFHTAHPELPEPRKWLPGWDFKKNKNNNKKKNRRNG